jgi:hypothetical protein
MDIRRHGQGKTHPSHDRERQNDTCQMDMPETIEHQAYHDGWIKDVHGYQNLLIGASERHHRDQQQSGQKQGQRAQDFTTPGRIALRQRGIGNLWRRGQSVPPGEKALALEVLFPKQRENPGMAGIVGHTLSPL